MTTRLPQGALHGNGAHAEAEHGERIERSWNMCHIGLGCKRTSSLGFEQTWSTVQGLVMEGRQTVMLLWTAAQCSW